ncbi:MAG: hypothetical protein J1E37_06140 [Prevotella sp.]|nr:hypothetical protein [Prevotella sp.]
MERYETSSNYQIMRIIRSDEPLSMKKDNGEDDVTLLLIPYITLDVKNNTATTILKSQFVMRDENPITNELIVNITYKFQNDIPVVKDGNSKIKIANSKDLFSIFDTSIGIFRGILYEWLKGSSLQQPLPLINMGEFLKELKYSFSK